MRLGVAEPKIQGIFEGVAAFSASGGLGFAREVDWLAMKLARRRAEYRGVFFLVIGGFMGFVNNDKTEVVDRGEESRARTNNDERSRKT